MVTVHWRGNMAFEAFPPSGNAFTMDATPESGGNEQGPTPLEALCASVAACSAMDVISILAKKKQIALKYRVEIEWSRAPEGTFPRPVTGMVVRHVVQGDALDPVAVARAVELSDQKYCTVISTIRTAPPIRSEFRIEEVD